MKNTNKRRLRTYVESVQLDKSVDFELRYLIPPPLAIGLSVEFGLSEEGNSIALDETSY